MHIDRAKQMICCGPPSASIRQCRAEMCLAWRWSGEKVMKEEVNEKGDPISRKPITVKSTTDGYCGLVGQE